jgi:adenine-specific DNA glycosylase
MLRHLGLYKQRAQQLKELAKAIVERFGGRIPDRWEDLAALPGVEPYIAGAVLSFGYGRPAPIVDSNVMRLLGGCWASSRRDMRTTSGPAGG